ncbi:hypothetical protein [Rhizobium sp. RU20A]|uniref:hypothetical protein n=1 Tax=Rhizobium sp. RU20A TaxID=1907412 RepID=UPI00122CDD4B|nr:hypothetical protein [Rhizobium sp. RU20A]
MTQDTPKAGKAGTTKQSPRWEGPEASRPRGYLPAKDDPDTEPDAVGETLSDPDRTKARDVAKTGAATRRLKPAPGSDTSDG